MNRRPPRFADWSFCLLVRIARWPYGLAWVFICTALTADAGASDPLETGAKGSFEIIPRLDSARPLPGEDLFLRITIRAIKPYETGPNPPGLGELASDPDSGFAGKFRVKLLERENPERVAENGAGLPGTVWTFDYQLTPIRQIDGTYPGEVPEFGLVMTRTDIPWPRLARQFTWLGPFPLRYVETGDGLSNQPSLPRLVPWWLGGALAAIAIVCIAVWEGILWRRSVRRGWKMIESAKTEPKALRDLLSRWLISRAVVLPAEPIPSEIHKQIAKAGYPQAVALAAQEIWADLNRVRFGRGAVDPAAMESLAQRAGKLIGNWSWVPWKRRLGYGLAQTNPIEHAIKQRQ